MTAHNQTSNPFSLGRFGDLRWPRQPIGRADRSIFASLADGFKAWRERRAAAAELASLSDRQLADIGLTRQDIPRVVSGRG